MPRNITAAEAIKSVHVEHIDGRTIVVSVESSLTLDRLWPYVRADRTVPDQIRRLSSVFAVPNPDPNTIPDRDTARQRVLDDVVWREDPGYVGTSRYTDGWVFVWMGRKQ